MDDVQGLGHVHLRRPLHIGGLVHRDGGQVLQLPGGGVHQLPGAQLGGGGDLEEGQALSLHVGPQGLQPAPVGGNVHLVARHQHGPVLQAGAVLRKLGLDGLKIGHRVPALGAGHVHHVDEQAAPVDVPQKVVAQAGALGGALDDAGDVGQNEGHPLLHVHHPQVGEQGGEVVVGDLGPGLAHHGEQGGLAHVGEAHQAHVGQELELQDHVPALAGQARLGEAGHLPGGGGEVLVAPAAVAPPGQHEAVGLGHVADDLLRLRVPHHRAPGHLDDQVRPVLAGAALALAVHAVFRHVLALVPEVHQGGLQDHAAPPAAVAAVGAAGGHVLLPVEGHRAVAAVARLDCDAGGIHKGCCHRVLLSCGDGRHIWRPCADRPHVFSIGTAGGSGTRPYIAGGGPCVSAGAIINRPPFPRRASSPSVGGGLCAAPPRFKRKPRTAYHRSGA